MIINKGASNKTTTIDLNGFTTSGQVNSRILTGADLAATAASLNRNISYF